jgi:hypothetical protein
MNTPLHTQLVSLLLKNPYMQLVTLLMQAG